MRRLLPPSALLLLAGCTGAATIPSASGTSASPASATTAISTTTATSTSTATASPEPALPEGVPPYFEDDVPSGDVPLMALIPLTAELSGSWYATTSQGEAIVVAWQFPGTDPFRLARGIAAWRRFDDGGAPWRPVWGSAFAKAAGVLGIGAITADVTGDASDDAIAFAETGGTGACGTYMVVDLATGETVLEREVCDTTIDPSSSPPGLLVREAVFEPGDPHCCPSAMRETVLTYSGGGWTEASEVVIPTS